jgi:uncharacterized protein involved in exopolysaccharide biosynthesis
VHGTNGFEVLAFVEYLVERRAAFLISVSVAILLALGISTLLPKRYTAKSTVLIEAPAGSDPRTSTALSPAYLESLKTYESFAGSDTLFARALARLHIKASRASALQVSRPGSTTVIEISATLNDPQKAQALAQYIAEQTVELDRSIETKTSDDVIGELSNQSQEALTRLTTASQAREAFAASNPIEALEDELRSGFDFKFRLDRDIAGARADGAPQSRIDAAEKQQQDLAAQLERKGAQLDARKSRRKALEDDEHAARSAYEELRSRLNLTLVSPQMRRVRLHVIDPGVVPQRPGFPNTWLNVVVAGIASVAGTFVWLLLSFSYVTLERDRSERLYSLH